MKLIDKIKNKLFPDEEEVLFHGNVNSEDAKMNSRISSANISDENTPICYKPQAFVNTEEIAETLLAGNTVIVDVSLMPRSESMRMLDFLSGVMFALEGDMKRINKTTFEYSINKKNNNK